MCVNDMVLLFMGQEYCGHIFSWPICSVKALFWSMFHTVLDLRTTLGMYSQSTRGLELYFSQV